MKRLAMSLCWLSGLGQGFHCENVTDTDMVIWHRKNKRFNFGEDFEFSLNSPKQIQDACNIMQCWANNVFGEYKDLKEGL